MTTITDRRTSVIVQPVRPRVVTLDGATVARVQAAQRVVPQPSITNAIAQPQNPVVRVSGMGAPGVDGDKYFEHVQSTPSAAWVVVHNLDKRPSVSVVDSGGELVAGDVTYDSPQQCTLRFAGAFSGKAYFN